MGLNQTHPLSFIKTVDQALLKLEQKPNFAEEISFPWESLVTKLQELFLPAKFADLSSKSEGWQTPEAVLSEINNGQPLEIYFLPLKEPVYWFFDEKDQKRLMATLLDGEEEAAYFLDPSYVAGFYSFFVASCLDKIQSLGFAKGLAPKIGTLASDFTEKAKREEGFFAIAITAKVNDFSFFGKLLIPSSFRKSWNARFAYNLGALPTHLKKELEQKLALEIAFEIGKTTLTLQEWKTVEPGDWVLLENCSYDPEEKAGRLLMTLNKEPLFRGKIKDNGIKLFEYPMYEEVRPMSADEFEEEEDEDLFEDLDEDFEEDDEEDLEEEEEEKEAAEEDATAPIEAKPVEKVALAEKSKISPENIPLEIIAEVGRIRMSAAELMRLAPGNFLELGITPERGIDLTVGGKKIGRGELVKLGDLLGIRILET